MAALLSVIGISLLPNVLLYFIPTALLTSTSGINVMKIMMTFASGGLLGDVFLHLIPDLLGNDNEHHDHDSHDHHHHSSHSVYIGLYILAGYLLFFVSQRLLQSHVIDSHSHNNNEATQTTRSRSRSKLKSKNNFKKSEINNIPSTFFGSFMKFNSMAWLNIVADCMHNFTDGLALGGVGGTPTILAILFHEIPHEIGDFTILMESGLSKFEAIRTQFITAISAVVGTLVGLYLTSHNIDSNKINRDILSSFTGGGFLYIATNMMPAGSHDVKVEQTLYESCCFILGVFFMFLVTKLE